MVPIQGEERGGQDQVYGVENEEDGLSLPAPEGGKEDLLQDLGLHLW